MKRVFSFTYLTFPILFLSLLFTVWLASANGEDGGPVIRVGLKYGSTAIPSIRVGSSSDLILRLPNQDKAFATGEAVVTFSSVPNPVTGEPEICVKSDSGREILRGSGPIIAVGPEGEGSYLYLGSLIYKYRGNFEISLDGNGMLRVINLVKLEEYLYSVVPSELQPYQEMEALKAQAVVARTYALVEYGKHKNDGFDICETVDCQVYSGIRSENPRTTEAVRRTAGQILMYNDSPAYNVKYHSSCGGVTDSSEEIWGGSIPYLVGKLCGISPDDADRSSRHDLSSERALRDFIDRENDSYCSGFNNYRWTEVFEVDRLIRIFNKRLPEILGKDVPVIQKIDDIRVLKRTRGGRIQELEIISGRDRIKVKGDYNIRLLFADSTLLKSSLFYIDGTPIGLFSQTITLKGAGNGHGVGMCQYGASGMAKRGFRYDQILAYYFPGTRLGQYDDTAKAVLSYEGDTPAEVSVPDKTDSKEADPAKDGDDASSDGSGTILDIDKEKTLDDYTEELKRILNRR